MPRLVWNGVLLFVTAWAAVWIPYRLAFAPREIPLSGSLDGILTLVWVADLALCLFAPVFAGDRSSLVVGKIDRRMRSTITSSWRWLFDLLAIVPWGRVTGLPVLDLLRLVKLVRLESMLRMRHRGNVLRRTLFRLGIFSFWLALLVHWLALGWAAHEVAVSAWVADGAYIKALYWCITTLTTVGYGDITPITEAGMLYSMLVMVLGVGVYGYVIGNVANVLSKIDTVKATYQSSLDRLAGFFRYRNIPVSLQHRVFDYYDHLYEKRIWYDESTVLADLPPSIRQELSFILRRDLVTKVPFLQEATQALIRDLCSKLRPEVYTPRDIIFQAGSQGRHMFFIGHGFVDIIADDDETLLERLGEGDFFGEIALLHVRPRSATARAVGYCDLYVLDRESFEQVIGRYPDFAAYVRDVAETRYPRTVRYRRN
ncbi:MAG: cyclic nucleotide-binding domain-containing protein [Trueperaceae bacterium]|nr:MAG: cyclic nucleotide-binding domain-containing protein [Trueperaceae bacterium]